MTYDSFSLLLYNSNKKIPDNIRLNPIFSKELGTSSNKNQADIAPEIGVNKVSIETIDASRCFSA